MHLDELRSIGNAQIDHSNESQIIEFENAIEINKTGKNSQKKINLNLAICILGKFFVLFFEKFSIWTKHITQRFSRSCKTSSQSTSEWIKLLPKHTYLTGPFLAHKSPNL